MTETENNRYMLVELQAAEQASSCSSFRPDVEEEWASDEPVSCLNCYFRRWTSRSFTCMAAVAAKPETAD